MAEATTSAPFPHDLLEHPSAAEAAPDLETTDPRLEAVGRLVAKGGYEAAGRAAAEVLAAGQLDVRIAGAYLYAVFLEEGIPGLPRVLRGSLALLTTNGDALRPKANSTAFLGNGLRWLFKTLTKRLEYHQRERDATWQAFCQPAGLPALEEALALVDPTVAALDQRLPGGACVQPFRHLAAWMEEHSRTLAAEKEKASEPPSSAAQEETVADAAPPPPRAPAAGLPPSVPTSPAFQILLNKLEAFDRLVAQAEFQKASIVAADVLSIVEHFDPRLYFPSIFTRFFAGLSAHADALEPLLDGQASLPARSLQYLYQCDLEAFVAHRARPGPGDQDG